MSNVRTDLLSDRTGLKPPGVTKADFIKAWLYLNQTTTPPTTQGSLNVSSVVDSAVGNTPVNFISAFSASLFAVAGVSYPIASNFDTVQSGPASSSQIVLYGTMFSAGTPTRADVYPQVQVAGVLA